jgi:hypothetical protein
MKAEYKIFHIPLDISVVSIIRNGLHSTRKKYGHLHFFNPQLALDSLEMCGYEVLDTFYTTAFKDLPATTWKSKIAKLPRHFWYLLSPDSMVKWLGGCSLIVVAK